MLRTSLYIRSFWELLWPISSGYLLSIAIILRLHGHLVLRLAIALRLAITLRGSTSKPSPCVTARARHAEV